MEHIHLPTHLLLYYTEILDVPGMEIFFILGGFRKLIVLRSFRSQHLISNIIVLGLYEVRETLLCHRMSTVQ